MLAHHIDNAGARLFCVVQVRKAIAEARPQMQQRRCRFAGDTVITVRRARHHTFKQTEYAAHAFDAIERRHKMHFRSAGIGETHIHVAIQQRANQTFCTVH